MKENKNPAENKIYINLVKNIQKRVLEEEVQEKTETPIDENRKKWDMNEKIVELFQENIENDLELRKTYAVLLIIILVIMLLALLTIFVLVGCGVLAYTDFAFNLFITGGIAEIFLLVRIIVKYLFNDNLKEALTIILKHNNPLKHGQEFRGKYDNKKTYKNSEKSREI